jgi:hypothetical protein
VGSEGSAANHRAVAEQGEPVGQIQGEPSLHYGGEGNTWSPWAQQGVRGRHGGEGACVTPGGLVRSRLTGSGTWAYKPVGEVAGNAVREVGVTSGTHEPGTNTSPGTVPDGGAAGGDPNGADQGEGVTSGGGEPGRDRASRRSSGLMVAAAMTETLALRTPGYRSRGV